MYLLSEYISFNISNRQQLSDVVFRSKVYLSLIKLKQECMPLAICQSTLVKLPEYYQ